jgi:hypothetical protein
VGDLVPAKVECLDLEPVDAQFLRCWDCSVAVGSAVLNPTKSDQDIIMEKHVELRKKVSDCYSGQFTRGAPGGRV